MMAKLKDMTDEQRRAYKAAQMRRYRAANPDKAMAQRLRDAASLLTRHGYHINPPTPAALIASDTDANTEAGEPDEK